MQNDHHVVEQLNAFLDGELSAAERNRVETHLASCASCAAEHHALSNLDARLRKELGELATPTAEMEARILRKLPAPRAAFRPVLLPLAAAALLGAAAGFALAALFLPHARESTTRNSSVRLVCATGAVSRIDSAGSEHLIAAGETIPLPARFVTPTGSLCDLSFSNGPRVRLSSDTAVASDAHGRELTLGHGELWVRAPSPLVLHLPSGTIRCTDGVFDVAASESSTNIVVTRGSIELESAATPTATIVSGEYIFMRRDGTVGRGMAPIPQKNTAWTFALLRQPENRDELRDTARDLLSGLGGGPGGEIRQNLLVSLGAPASATLAEFLAARKWHPPAARRQAARALASVVPAEAPAQLVEELFPLLDEDDAEIRSALVEAVSRATSLPPIPNPDYWKEADRRHRKDMIEKWRSAWRLRTKQPAKGG